MGIKEDSDKYILNTYARFQIAFTSGKGMYLFSDDNKQYLDMAAGIATSSLGHAHPALIKAITAQAKTLIHTSNLYYSEPCTKLAKTLVEKSIFDKVFFCNSGAEANEAAIKLSRKFGKSTGNENKYKIITMKNSFHGRTLTTISATGQTKYQKGFEPLTPGFTHVELNNKEELKNTFNHETVAVIIEPVQGEGGVRLASLDYLKYVRELCDKYNAILIYDEVQCGVGRTGKLFAYENFLPVEPDIVTFAKGLAGGLPIGAMLVKEKFAGYLKPGEHASTFGGNLVCSSAALAVLDTIEKKDLLKKITKASEYFKRKVKSLKKKHKSIKEARGLGYLLGVEFDFPSREMVNALTQKGIVTVPAGDFVVRFIPPLIAEKKHFDIVLNALDEILTERENS
jgi:acetylornithine/N-succinyldiaminopimelate aminotransferase